MAVPNEQIGWSQESKLLQYILKQLSRLTQVVSAYSGGSGSGGVWGTLTGTLSNQTDLQTALNAKQNSLGYTSENVANKDTDGTLAANSDTKYPSQKATKTYADAKVADAINNGTTTIAPSQNAVYDALILKQALANSAVALGDASTIDLTDIKHTLVSSSATRTFTISYTGDDITIEVTLNNTAAVYTFPASALCVTEGAASGDNTLALSGVSGDKYIIAIKKIGSAYYVVSKNFGQ